MASSPPAPFPATLPNPKKRPSMSSQVVTTNKRPRLHPLRQTSFPANHDVNAHASAMASARSETGSVAGSAFSTKSMSKAQPRGRGRPRKSLQITADDTHIAREGENASGAKILKARSQVSTSKSAVNADDDGEEEEEEEEELQDHGGEDIQIDEYKQYAADMVKLENKLMKGIQYDRYHLYRSTKLKDAVVRRIVNQTVSQSVTLSAIQAVQFFSKAFTIEIIERAREVQNEYAQAAKVAVEEKKRTRQRQVLEKERNLVADEKAAAEQDPLSTLPEHTKTISQDEPKTPKAEAEKYIPNKHMGGMLPDHLREALRRYKADGDGNGFGFDGLSHPLLGVGGSAAWRAGDGGTGRRLLR